MGHAGVAIRRDVDLASINAALGRSHNAHVAALVNCENSRCWAPIQVRPDALRSSNRGCPPDTGTIQVSQIIGTVYAISEPSGENTGLIFVLPSQVSCLASPSGNRFT